MRTGPAATATDRSFFAKLFGSLRAQLRKLFGKKDDPNIYPFF
jgi:hypothetical protein